MTHVSFRQKMRGIITSSTSCVPLPLYQSLKIWPLVSSSLCQFLNRNILGGILNWFWLGNKCLMMV